MNLITDLISDYGLAAMFVIIMLEYACFPVSSEIVLPFFGAVASVNHHNFFVVLPLSVLAGLLGTGFCYGIGWFGGGAILHAITNKFPKAQKGIDAAYKSFDRHGAATVCIGRVIPLIRTYIAPVAGAAKLRPVTYFSASALGITVWNTLLLGLGYVLRENYQTVAGCYVKYKHYLIPVLIIFVCILLINHFTKKNTRRK